MADGAPNRRLYETAVLATLRDKLRSGDIWVERSSGYRRFESYLLPSAVVPAAAAKLGLPATADEWLAAKSTELDHRLNRFARRLRRGELEGIEYHDDRLHINEWGYDSLPASIRGVRDMTGRSPLSATEEQQSALAALASSRDRGEADRARAIRLTLAGWTSARIAEAFRRRGEINESCRPEQSKDRIRNLLGTTRGGSITLVG